MVNELYIRPKNTFGEIDVHQVKQCDKVVYEGSIIRCEEFIERYEKVLRERLDKVKKSNYGKRETNT